MKREEILQEASKIVTGARQNEYGPPEQSFAVIANLWGAYLENLVDGHRLSSVDVAAMMILFKLGRVQNSPDKTDHWIDIAGYSACGGEIATEESG